MTGIADAPDRSHGRRLVLAVRDPSTRARLAQILSAGGHSVQAVDPAATDWLGPGEPEPAAAILDLAPDAAAGLDDLARLREVLPADVPVLLLHPVAEASTMADGFRGGADDMLVRPFDDAELSLRLLVMLRARDVLRELAAANLRLHALGRTDDLTGLANPRAFAERLGSEHARLRRFGLPLAQLVVACDDLASVAASHGQAMSNLLLREIARLLVANLRDTDLPGRTAPAEFGVLLPGTDLAGARVVAHRLRELVSMTVFSLGADEVRVTLSVGGAAAVRERPGSLATLEDRAAAALRRARSAGGGRVRIEDEEESP